MTDDDQVARVLRGRADAVPDRIDLAGVRARVITLRRRRRTALAVAVAAAVLAIIIPTTILNRPSASGPVAPPPSPSSTPSPPSPTPSRSPTPQRSPSPWRPQVQHSSSAFAMLPAGAPPRLAYVFGGHTFAAPGKEARPLPAPMDQTVALAPVGDDWLVAGRPGAGGMSSGMGSSGTIALTLLDSALRPVWTRFGADTFAAGDGTIVYFTIGEKPESTGTLHLVGNDGKRLASWAIPFSQVAVPAGIIAGTQVAYTLTTLTGHSLGAWVTRPDAEPVELPMQFAIAATGDLVAGQLHNGCQVVVDIASDAQLWRKCGGFRLGSFSPDGRYLAAWHTATGGEFEVAYVLDARTGRPITDTTKGSPDSFHAMPSGGLTWEDDNHLLIVEDDSLSDDWEVVRMDLAGHLERATGALHDATGNVPFVVATQP